MLEYLLSEYARTKWPFFYVVKLKEKGLFEKDEANKLASEGRIKKREGMHGVLIELIITNEET